MLNSKQWSEMAAERPVLEIGGIGVIKANDDGHIHFALTRNRLNVSPRDAAEIGRFLVEVTNEEKSE